MTVRPQHTHGDEEDEAVRVCHGVLWLADNIHNYGTDAWRGYFMACVRDARRVVGYGEAVTERRTKLLRRMLREFVITLDVLLGGDHRSSGHRPPSGCVPPTQPPSKPRNIR